MKIVNKELGRVVLLIALEDFRPISGFHFPSFIEMIQSRYAFGCVPAINTPLERFQQEGLKFQSGKLVVGGNQININELAFYSDGIVLNGYSTDESETFLNDLLSWGKQSLGIRIPTDKERRMYVSQIIVEFSNDINPLIASMEEIAKRLSSAIKDIYSINQPMEWTGVSFSYDRTLIPSLVVPAGFMMERRINHPFELNRYYSESPLPTPTHIEVLEAIEKLATSRTK